MSLQSIPDHGHLSSTRHMVGMSRSLSSSHAPVGNLSAHHGHSPYNMDSSYANSRLSYGGGSATTLHPSHSANGSHGSGGNYLSVPMSAPPTLTNPNPFLGSQPHQQQSLYSHSTQSSSYLHSPQNGTGRVLTPHDEPQQRYSFPDSQGHPPSPQSGYATPQ